MRVLVTGACGFAGSHIVEELLRNQENRVVALDCLTYAGRLDRLAHLDRSRIQFVCHDMRIPFSEALLSYIGAVTHVIHNGAETHVARSFGDPGKFVDSNIIGTLNVLEAARQMNLEKFIYVSTDEVFGPSYGRAFKEDDALLPTNPYAATKAAGEHLTYSYFRSFGLPAIITRTMNMFGERQHAEKFVPKTIATLLAGRVMDIHVSPDGEVGTRHWLHASEQARSLNILLSVGKDGESYNISAGTIKSNLEIVGLIASILGVKKCQIRETIPETPFHDLHYSIDDSKMRQLWTDPYDFDSLFRKTVLWYKNHPEYLEE